MAHNKKETLLFPKVHKDIAFIITCTINLRKKLSHPNAIKGIRRFITGKKTYSISVSKPVHNNLALQITLLLGNNQDEKMGWDKLKGHT